jgi:hypothetical protein
MCAEVEPDRPGDRRDDGMVRGEAAFGRRTGVRRLKGLRTLSKNLGFGVIEQPKWPVP